MSELVSGNIMIRKMHAKRGKRMCPPHFHNFDHTHFVDAPGAVVVDKKGADGRRVVREFGEGTGLPAHFLIEAGALHEITALDPPPPSHVVALADAAAMAAAGKLTPEQLKRAVDAFWIAHSATEVTGMCVYSHRTPQGEVTQLFTGWEDAYN